MNNIRVLCVENHKEYLDALRYMYFAVAQKWTKGKETWNRETLNA